MNTNSNKSSKLSTDKGKQCEGCRSKTSSNGNSSHSNQSFNKFAANKSKVENKQVVSHSSPMDKGFNKKYVGKYARAQIISQFFG